MSTLRDIAAKLDWILNEVGSVSILVADHQQKLNRMEELWLQLQSSGDNDQLLGDIRLARESLESVSLQLRRFKEIGEEWITKTTVHPSAPGQWLNTTPSVSIRQQPLSSIKKHTISNERVRVRAHNIRKGFGDTPEYRKSHMYRNVTNPKLPKSGIYRTYDVNPRSGMKADGERIIIDENTGKIWYTYDHYASFEEIS